MPAVPKLLFVPVSGRYGMGEYARSLAIAQGAARRWPEATIHFVLSGQAPYAAEVPFAATLLPSSATFHSAEVTALLASLRPDIVIFDNAGRSAQLRAARRAGARIVYISSRRRQRRKAFRWSWMRLLDEHWLAYPQFVAGPLGSLERLKLKLMGRPTVRYLDVVLPRADAALRTAILARAGCTEQNFVLFVPGGGTGHPGADDAPDSFWGAANVLSAAGVPVAYVGRGRGVGLLTLAELAELMRSARLVVANGGSTLLQALGCGAAVIAVPIAGDQAERTRRCVAAGVTVAARLDSAAIVAAADALLQNDAMRRELAARAASLTLADGMEVAVDALAGLLGPAIIRTA
jgi:hypothetical protein